MQQWNYSRGQWLNKMPFFYFYFFKIGPKYLKYFGEPGKAILFRPYGTKEKLESPEKESEVFPTRIQSTIQQQST